MSRAAEKLFYLMAERHGFGPELFDSKVNVIYPAVDTASITKKKHSKDGVVKLLFIGNSFFRKGGRALLRAFKTLSKDFDIELTIISNLTLPDFFTQSDDQDRHAAMKQMENDKNINWIQNVPNTEILDYHFPESDIFIMPTLQDSFGFVNIEAMACGLPVISTRQFAVPEQVIHDETGYLIDLPLDEMGRLNCIGEKDRLKRKQSVFEVEEWIYEQLVQFGSDLCGDPLKRRKFGENGKQRVQTLFDVNVRNNALMQVYGNLHEFDKALQQQNFNVMASQGKTGVWENHD